MSWESLVLVTDRDLGRMEPEAVDETRPWGRSSWPDQIQQAKRTVRTWVDRDHAAIIGASDRLKDRYSFSEAKTFTGGAYTDVPTQAKDKDEEDLNLATILATPASDAIYLGARFAATGVFVHLLDSVNAAASTLTVSYWGRAQWTTVPSQVDGTASGAATFAQSGRVTWGRIQDWETRSLDGSDERIYWLRLQVNNALTAGTSATQLMALRRPDGLETVVSWVAIALIMKGLASQSTEPEEWRTRATEYMEDARSLYSELKMAGAIPLDLDQSGAIEPTEVGPSTVLSVGRMPRA